MNCTFGVVGSDVDGDKARKLARWLDERGIECRIETRTVVLAHTDDVRRARELIDLELEYGAAAEGGA